MTRPGRGNSRRRRGAVAAAVEACERRTYFAGLAFAPASSTAVGAGVTGLATGDFTGDGAIDAVVIADPAAGTLALLAGSAAGSSGSGGFAVPVTFSAGATDVRSVTGANLNAGANRDLIIVSGGGVSVALGNGDGTFAAPTPVASGAGPREVVVAEINGNGVIDLAVANAGGDSVTVLFGNGDGTFASQGQFAAGKAPASIAAGDFDGDADLDFAVANFGAATPDAAGAGVTILVNDGAGAFVAQPTMAAGARPVSIDVGPLNVDGDLDLVVANGGTDASPGSDSVSVFLGSSGASFAAKADYATAQSPRFVRLGNLNLDGVLDVATANAGGGNVSVLLGSGSGDGTLATALPFATAAGSSHVARADVNGDGDIDLVTTNGSAGTVSVLINESEPAGPTGAVDATQAGPAFGATSYDFTVTYTDTESVDTTSFGDDDLTVTPPGVGAAVAATFVGVVSNAGFTTTARYRLAAPGGAFDPADDGSYAVSLNAGAVRDLAGARSAGGAIGAFALSVPDEPEPPPPPPPPPGDGPDLTASVAGRFVTSVVAGAKGSASVTVTSAGDTAFDGTVRVALFVSADDTFDANSDIAAGTPVDRRLKLKPGSKKVVKLRFTFPDVPVDGPYSLLGVVDPASTIAESNEGNNAGIAPTIITIRHAFIDLAGSVPALPAGPLSAAGDEPLALAVALQNLGSVAARGSVMLEVVAVPTAGGAEIVIGTMTQKVSLKPDASRTVRLKLRGTSPVTPGTYDVRIRLSPTQPLVDEVLSNNTIEGGNALPFA